MQSQSLTEQWPYFDDEQIDAVTQILQSGKTNYWVGNQGRLFEEEYAEYCGVAHGIAVANGTLALELALHAIDVGPGDEVIVPSRTFIASASCVVARGARPLIADIDRDSQTITVDTIKDVITPKTKAIVAVHLAGWPCDMQAIMAFAREKNIAVVEDCAQAHGAEYQGRPVGSLGDIAAFSFCQDKIISTGGEGGMLVTNRSDLWERAWRYKDHGKPPSSFYDKQPPSAKFRWLHDSFGSNFRMTEMQSAIGRISLRRLPAWIELRQSNAKVLIDSCNANDWLRTPVPSEDFWHAYYKFYTFIRPERLPKGVSHETVIHALQSVGVPCLSGSCSEIYLEKAFPNKWRPSERLPVAHELGATSLIFPVHPTLKSATVQEWATKITSLPKMLKKVG